MELSLSHNIHIQNPSLVQRSSSCGVKFHQLSYGNRRTCQVSRITCWLKDPKPKLKLINIASSRISCWLDPKPKLKNILASSQKLPLCKRLGSSEQAHAGDDGFGQDIVGNTGKWRSTEDARNLCEKMLLKNVVSWNALIDCYGNQGHGIEALELFKRMISENISPDHDTFYVVLSACSYSGLSDQGWEIFKAMGTDFKEKPQAMHYVCMIELLGHQGLLDEAVALIQDAPFEPPVTMWAALLTACRVHKNLELGKFAADKIYAIDPEKLSNYAPVLVKLYKSCGKHEEAASVFQTLEKKGVRMLLAHTYIDVKKQQHMFLSGDKSGSHVWNLMKLLLRIVGYGYVPTKNSLLPGDQYMSLLFHSEKLAVSFGLLKTPHPMPLHLQQSHLMCDDCHLALKLISKVTGRVIVLRDASRFHRFTDGKCSCDDYW